MNTNQWDPRQTFHVLGVHRSGVALAAEKARIAELEKEVLMLAAEADDLKSFTQGYMVKASSEKQNVR